MNKISTYFPVASKELHAVLEMVSNVKEKELEKKSAAINIVAEKERSDKIPEKYATYNAMRSGNDQKNWETSPPRSSQSIRSR